MVPISYSVGGEWLHNLIASYKRDADPSVPAAATELAWILHRFLAVHEGCVAREAGVDGFDVVTTVPSSDRTRDERHPLRRLVASALSAGHDDDADDISAVPRRGAERLLRRSDAPFERRRFDARRYEATRSLHGESVLLIDDMWTSGVSAQSAAAALRRAGARAVAVVVIARHLNRGWHQNDARLHAVARRGFDFSRCVVCDVGAPRGF